MFHLGQVVQTKTVHSLLSNTDNKVLFVLVHICNGARLRQRPFTFAMDLMFTKLSAASSSHRLDGKKRRKKAEGGKVTRRVK